MGRTDAVAHDPSVADYRATSPRFAREEIDLADVSTLWLSGRGA